MGIVYKAEDTKLERTVALKFCSQQFTVDQTEKDRFLLEARAASAINHPNVCVIHDIQEHEGQQFIVMEYLEGKTLRKRLTHSEAEDLVPCWSFDGNWIYFASNRSGQRDIWRIQSTGGQPEQITFTGCYGPQASSDGQWIYYVKDGKNGLFRISMAGTEQEIIPDYQNSFVPGSKYRYQKVSLIKTYFTYKHLPVSLKYSVRIR
ncbi:PD40 domain-containing protein [candidate division KSB1 bacterium]|nr:PD40 domain-containing protein [candidate division KSB1 bacterium]